MNKNLIYSVVGMLIATLCMPTFWFPIAGASEDEWITMAAMPTARRSLGVAVVDGKIYAIGGSNNDGQLAVNEEYNPLTNTWTTKAPMPTARSGFAITVYQNKIYCIGGTIGDDETAVTGFTGVNEVYDPEKNTWETKASMPTHRTELCASIVNGKIYLIGGKEYLEVNPFYHELDVNEVYNPESNSWTTNASMPVPAFGYASAVADDKIYVIGGLRQLQLDGPTAIGINQVYNSKNDTWSSQASLPVALGYSAACITTGVTAPKKLYVVGGFNQNNYSNATYVYDFKYNMWSSGKSMPMARDYLGLAVVDDSLYSIGGFDGQNSLAANEQYVPIGYGTIPPELQVLSPENKTYPSNNVQLILTVSRPTTWIRYSLDRLGNATVSGDTMLSELSEGSHRLVIYVNDTFGNIISSNTVYFSVDTVPPRVIVLSPENKTYGETDIKLIFTVNEPVSWMGYSLNGQDNTTISGNVTLAVLPEGSHNLIVYARDIVGNTGASETFCFVIAPFPTVLVVGVVVTITIATAIAYLLLKRRKFFTAKAKKRLAA